MVIIVDGDWQHTGDFGRTRSKCGRDAGVLLRAVGVPRRRGVGTPTLMRGADWGRGSGVRNGGLRCPGGMQEQTRNNDVDCGVHVSGDARRVGVRLEGACLIVREFYNSEYTPHSHKVLHGMRAQFLHASATVHADGSQMS